MRSATEEEYKKALVRYVDIDITKPTEAYEKLLKKKLTDGYIKGVLSAYKWGVKDDNAKKEYSKIIKIIAERESKKEKNVNRFKKIDWNKLEFPKGDDIDSVIKGMYMLVPRRVTDYAYMMYDGDDTDTDKNHYKEGKFIFNNYKTVGKYGRQEIDVPKELNEKILRYVKKEGIKSGDALLKYSRGNEYSKQTLMKKIKKIFGTSVDGVRHSYITHLYKDGNNLFNVEELSLRMGHDVKTHLRYLDKENKF